MQPVAERLTEHRMQTGDGVGDTDAARHLCENVLGKTTGAGHAEPLAQRDCAVTDVPPANPGSTRFDLCNDFVAQHRPGCRRLSQNLVRTTDAAGMYPHPQLTGSRLGDLQFAELKASGGDEDLGTGSHG